MKKEKPLVSVVMPVYNGGIFLKKAIQSILKQTYTNLELIIIDDGSNDGSSEIIKKYQKEDPRIHVLINKKPSGYAGEAAANQGIKFAKGKYIARMDADDISILTRLEKEVEFLEKNTDIFLVGSKALIIDGKDKIIGRRNVPLKNSEIYKKFYLKNCIIHPSVLFRNEKLDEDFYKLIFPDMNDYLNWMRLMSLGKKFSNIDDYLIKYRVHGQNATFKKIKNKFRQNIQIKKMFIDKYNYKPRLLYLFLVNIEYTIVRIFPESILFKIYMLFPNK